MPPTHLLKCLGEPALLTLGGHPVRIRVRKHLGLLVYLVVEYPTRHSRSHLAELFWPNLGQAEARHSLATALTTLRAALQGEVIENSSGGLRWKHDGLTTDLEMLSGTSESANEGGEYLELAGFLEGFEIPDTTEFMLWRERQRARWLPHLRDALVIRMDRARRTGNSRMLEATADRLLSLDDLSEDAIRAKMEARAFAGDRLAAVRLYDEWRDRLATEVSALPSDQMQRVAHRLRRHGIVPEAGGTVPRVPTEQWKNRPFIGRAKEYRRLYEHWEQVQAGGSASVLVVGESGVGKTTLVDRIITAAALTGASTSRIQCYDLDHTIPYATAGNLVASLIGKTGSVGTNPDSLAALSLISPDVRAKYPTTPPAPELLGDATRLRLAAALADLIRSVADEQPVVLAIDDFHLADDASLAILQTALRRLTNIPTMLVFVFRTSDKLASSQSARMRDTFGNPALALLELNPLSDDDAGDLVSALCSDAASPIGTALKRSLVRAGKGFPMAIELLCNDWLAHGSHSVALALDAMTPDLRADTIPSEAYKRLYERIVASLDPPTRNTLALAAILGRRLADTSMYSIVDLSLGQTVASMTQLTALRVLRDGSPHLDFANELIRSYAYLGVPSPLRRLLHGHIADRLLEAHSASGEQCDLEIAWHCIRAGRGHLAARYLLRGALQAMQSGAPHEAELALRSGAALLTGGAQHAEGRLLLAECLQEQSDWAESLRILSEEWPTATPRLAICASALTCIANCNLYRYDDAEIQHQASELRHALQCTEDSGALSLLARALSCLVMQARHEQLAGSTILALREREQFVATGIHRQTWSLSLLRLKYFADKSSKVAPGLSSLSEEMLATSNRSAGAADLAIGRGNACCSQGNYIDAIAFYDQAYRLASDLGNRTLLASAAVNQAMSHGILGNYQEQIRLAKLALSHEEDSTASYRRLLARATLAIGLAMTSEEGASRGVIDEMRCMRFEAGPRWVGQIQQLLLADAYHFAGLGKSALAAGRLGTTGQYNIPLASCFSGIHARWLVKTTSDPLESVAYLDAALAEAERLDVIDCADLAVSRAWLMAQVGKADRDAWEHAWRLVGMLPAAYATHLSSLDLLGTDSSEYGGLTESAI